MPNDTLTCAVLQVSEAQAGLGGQLTGTGFKRRQRGAVHTDRGRGARDTVKWTFKAICATETATNHMNVFFQTAGHNGVPDYHSAALPVQDQFPSSGTETPHTRLDKYLTYLLKCLNCVTANCSVRCRSESLQATVTR